MAYPTTHPILAHFLVFSSTGLTIDQCHLDNRHVNRMARCLSYFNSSLLRKLTCIGCMHLNVFFPILVSLVVGDFQGAVTPSKNQVESVSVLNDGAKSPIIRHPPSRPSPPPPEKHPANVFLSCQANSNQGKELSGVGQGTANSQLVPRNLGDVNNSAQVELGCPESEWMSWCGCYMGQLVLIGLHRLLVNCVLDVSSVYDRKLSHHFPWRIGQQPKVFVDHCFH